MKRILVALDASPRATLVLAAATRLAEMSGAKLVLYRATNAMPDIPREILLYTDTRLEDFLRGNTRAELEKLAATTKPELIERIVVDLAVAWDGIVRAGRELDADLIVLGSHGYGTIDRFLGTTAGKVVNHADRNVFVVRTVV